MTQQTHNERSRAHDERARDANDGGSAGSSDAGASDPGGESKGGAREAHGANKRVAQLRGGLEKAVTGREDAIKSQALKWAERLDERWQGRHHNKLHAALKAVEFVVDRASRSQDTSRADEDRSERHDQQRGAPSSAQSNGASDGADGPEDLGEFHNVTDDERETTNGGRGRH